MALIRCPECKKKVSESTELCPHCGFSINKPGAIIEEKEIMKISHDIKRTSIEFLVFVVLLISFLVFIGIVFSNIYDGKYNKYYILISFIIVIIVILKLLYEIYYCSKIELILTNKRITGRYKEGLFQMSDFDYPLSTVKSISTTSFFGTGTIIISFYEGFLSSSWLRFTCMKNVKEFKNKFFEIGK